jgi:hypothetical protein
MPYDFYIPTDPVDWTRATLNEDGTLVVHDYDLDPDIALVALGGDPSLVMDVMKYWEDDPISFLCGKAKAIPIKDCGVAAWSWAAEAIHRRQDDFYQHPALRAELDKALAVVFSALTKKRLPFKRLIVAKRNVSNMIADTLSFHYGKLVRTRTGDAMTAVRQLLDGIIQMVEDVEYFGFPGDFDHFCDVAVSTSKAIRHGSKVKELWEEEIQYVDDVGPLLIELAVSKMGEVQRARGGL